MAVDKEKIEQMVRNAQGIPANPEIAARMVQSPTASANPLQPEPQPEELGLDPNAAAADFFGGLAADMDAEVGSAPPLTAVPQQPKKAEVFGEELPYEPPVHQRQDGEAPESLAPRVGEESQPLEAAIEQPLAEEDIRLTAEQWAAAQQAAQPKPEQPAPPQQQFDPAELEKQAIEQLTATEYALSEDDATALISEPEKVLPGLAARMHVRMQVQLANQLSQVLPHMIQQQFEQLTKVQTLENQFFGQYPELNKPEFRDTVQQSLAMIRQVNPQATREEVMRDGAALAAVRLKTRLGEAQSQAPTPTLPQDMPLASPANRTPQPQAPFTPAHSGGGSLPVVPTNPEEDNVFALLANDPNW